MQVLHVMPFSTYWFCKTWCSEIHALPKRVNDSFLIISYVLHKMCIELENDICHDLMFNCKSCKEQRMISIH
jgi:hypothetical protein